jgi:hypothetical protein
VTAPGVWWRASHSEPWVWVHILVYDGLHGRGYIRVNLFYTTWSIYIPPGCNGISAPPEPIWIHMNFFSSIRCVYERSY